MEEQDMNASRRPFNMPGDLSDHLSGQFSGLRGKFRRRPDRAIVMGVCAGIADYFSLDSTVVRVVALLLLWLFTVPAMVLYLLLTWIGDPR
jgi:phage shock protein PspC (stress-responsive transcriptional regulator)